MGLLWIVLPTLLTLAQSSPALNLNPAKGDNNNYNNYNNYNDECLRLDAAINFKGVIYFFAGDHFIQLDRQNREIRKNNIFDNWGHLEDIDAALSYGDTAYLFKGSYYFYFSYPFGMVGPLSNFRWGAEIGNRVDAAISGGVNGSMFLKDCKLYDFKDGGFESSRDLSDDDIPCNIDAAVGIDGEEKAALFKYDKVWYISLNGSVSGPFDANAEFHLSLRFCSEKDVDYRDLINAKENEMKLKPDWNKFGQYGGNSGQSADQDAIRNMWKNKFSKYWKPSKYGSSSNGGGISLRKRHYYKNSKISELVENKKTGLKFMIEAKKARLDSIDNVDDKEDVEQMIEQGGERIEQVIEHAGARLEASGLRGAALDQEVSKQNSRLSRIIDDDERTINEILARLEAHQYDDDDDDQYDFDWDK